MAFNVFHPVGSFASFSEPVEHLAMENGPSFAFAPPVPRLSGA